MILVDHGVFYHEISVSCHLLLNELLSFLLMKGFRRSNKICSFSWIRFSVLLSFNWNILRHIFWVTGVGGEIAINMVLLLSDSWWFCGCDPRWEANDALVELICEETAVNPLSTWNHPFCLESNLLPKQWNSRLVIFCIIKT